LYDDVLVYQQAEAETGNGDAQESEGKNGKDGKVGNRRGSNYRVGLYR
jgi:hypothetical protein